MPARKPGNSIPDDFSGFRDEVIAAVNGIKTDIAVQDAQLKPYLEKVDKLYKLWFEGNGQKSYKERFGDLEDAEKERKSKNRRFSALSWATLAAIIGDLVLHLVYYKLFGL